MPIRAFTQMRKVSVKNRSYISMFTSFCMTGCPFCRNTAVRLGKAKYGAVGTHSGGNNNIVFSLDRKSTRLNSSHGYNSYAVFCLKKKNIEMRVVQQVDDVRFCAGEVVVHAHYFFSVLHQPPASTLFPYTTLFRSSMFTSFCMTGCPFCRNTAVRLGKAKYGAVGTHSGGNNNIVFSLRPDFGALLWAAFPTICMRPLDIGFTQWVRRSTLEDNSRSRVSTISCLWNLEPRTQNLEPKFFNTPFPQ